MPAKINELVDDLERLFSEKADVGRIQIRIAKIRVVVETLLGENRKLTQSLDSLQKEHYQALRRLRQVAELTQLETEFKSALKKQSPAKSRQ